MAGKSLVKAEPTEVVEEEQVERTTKNSLATKYRPRRLEEVVGQDAVVAEIKGMMKTGEIPPAILLVGISGVAKTTLARIIAHYLNCENFDNKKITVCGKCSVCLRVDAGGDPPDYQEVNSGDEGGIDNIRSLIQKSRLRPRNKIRIILFDEAHRLTMGAVNALLKPLEEPSPSTMWMLATTDPEKIPNSKAVKGRCGLLQLKPVGKEDAANRLLYIGEQEGYKWLTERSALAIGEAAGGHMRDAVQILSSVRKKLVVMDKLPKGSKLVRIIRSLAHQVESSDTDKVAMLLLHAIYLGKPALAMKCILEAEDYVALINKLLNINWFLTGSMVSNVHPKLWRTKVNSDTLAAIKKDKPKLSLSDTLEVHKELTKLRGETQAFTVGAEHLLVSSLVDLAYEFRD